MKDAYERAIAKYRQDTLYKLRIEQPTPAKIVKGYQTANENYHRTVLESHGGSGESIAGVGGVRDAHATYAAEVGVDLNEDYGQAQDPEALKYARMIALCGRSKEDIRYYD